MIIKCACCNNGKIQRFSHIEGGTCFSCDGAGVVEVEETPKNLALIKARAKKAQTRISNTESAIANLTGYEQGYNSAVKSLLGEIEKDQKVIDEIAVYAPLIAESAYLKCWDFY